LTAANLIGVNLSNACLENAVLIGADLRLSNLVGAGVFFANFSQANLAFAKFGNLSGAVIDGVNFYGVQPMIVREAAVAANVSMPRLSLQGRLKQSPPRIQGNTTEKKFLANLDQTQLNCKEKFEEAMNCATSSLPWEGLLEQAQQANPQYFQFLVTCFLAGKCDDGSNSAMHQKAISQLKLWCREHLAYFAGNLSLQKLIEAQ
jgi:hypothetical protein